MTAEKYCVNCGAPLEEGQRFCPGCGQRTDTLAEESAGLAEDTASLAEDTAAAVEPKDVFEDEPAAAAPPPPPPPPPSGGLRPAASSSPGGQPLQPVQRPASPPPLGGQGGPAGSRPAQPARPARVAPPAQPSMSAEEPKKSKKTLYIALGCGCLAILVALIIVIVMVVRGTGGFLNQIQSAVGEVDGPPIEQAVTVEAAPEGTPEATVAETTVAEPTAGQLSSGPSRDTLLYEEDFTDPSSGWDEFSGDDQTVGYEGGRYMVVINATNWMSWGNAYQWFDDGIVVEVDATKIGGPDDNGFGLVFGYQDGDNFYRYEIASDGYYRLGKYVNNEWVELIPWTETDQLNLGNATNTIAAEMSGGTISLYANDSLLGSTRDSSFSSGDVGLVAGSFDIADVAIAFDRFRVYAVEGGGASAPVSRSTEVPATEVPATDVPVASGGAFVAGSRGALLYSDDFADTGTGWDEFSGSEQSVGYSDGRYVIAVYITDWMTWGNAYEWFDDGIVVEVDATKIGGPDDNGFGIVFGYQDVDNFYRYEIASDGYYRLGKYVDNEWIEVIPWVETDLVNLGAATNTIAVEMGGGTISLYANGSLLDSVVDRTFSDGDVGLVAGSFGQPNVQIAFDRLRVYALESQGGASSSAGGSGAVVVATELYGAWYGVDTDGVAGYFQFMDDGTFIIADTELGYWGDGQYRLEQDGGELWIMYSEGSGDWQPLAAVEFLGPNTIFLMTQWGDSVEMERISEAELDTVLKDLEYDPLF